MNKSPQSNPVNQLQSCEIDFDESLAGETTYLRSKSVDNRTNLKLSQTRSNGHVDQDDSHSSTGGGGDDHQSRLVPPSKFTSISNRRDIPVRINDPVNKYSTRIRSRTSNGNLFDVEIENDENRSSNDHLRTRTNIPVQRYPTNTSSIQSSASTSSVSSTMSRNKPTCLDSRHPRST